MFDPATVSVGAFATIIDSPVANVALAQVAPLAYASVRVLDEEQNTLNRGLLPTVLADDIEI